MDQIGVQEQKAMAEQKNYQTLKKVTKWLFSISLFSFFFALPSLLPFHLFHSLNLNSPTLRFHLFNQPIDKNSMFLLCNGLLVFLANYSGLFKTLSTSRKNYESFKVYNEFESSLDPILTTVQKPLIERETTETAVSPSLPREILNTSTEERIDMDSESDRDVEEESYGLENSFFAMERVEEDESITYEEEGNGGVLSDEELNKKFDEFIKRMKEEIIVDSRRTLVVV